MLNFLKKTSGLIAALNSWRSALLGAVCVVTLMLATNDAEAGKLDTYWTTNPNVAKKIPMANGANGWNKGIGGTVPAGWGNCIWFAWRNEDNNAKNKFFREFLRANGEKFDIEQTRGFFGETDQFPSNHLGLKSTNGNPKVREFQFWPQPKWERIKIVNKEFGNAPWLLQVEAWSVCAKVRPANYKTVSIEGGTFGAPGAMQGNPRTTELVFFPWYSPIDAGAIPTFSADAQTGNWTFEFVNVDPLGNARPEGGIRWTTDGQGLLTGDEFDATFEVLGLTSGCMSMFAYDAETGVYLPWDMIDFGPPMIEPFDIYQPGEGIIGWRGWSGFDDDPTLDAIVAPGPFLSPPCSLDVQQNANVVRQMDAEGGQWHFSTWTFIPGGYQGGSQFLLFDQYQPNGPQHPALITQFDSNTSQLFFLCGDPNPIQVPYIVDQWVPIDVVVDLDNDHCMVFYDQQPVCEYAWTAGAFGDGNGQPNIAAVNLWGNGSASIFYDDMLLLPMTPPEEPVEFTDFEVLTGVHTGGSLLDLETVDGQSLTVRSGLGQSIADLYQMNFRINGVTTLDAATLDLRLEANVSDPGGIGRIQLKNWTTGQFETVSNYAISDSAISLQVNDLDASQYVSNSGEIELDLKHSLNLPLISSTPGSIVSFTFDSSIDQLTVIARE